MQWRPVASAVLGLILGGAALPALALPTGANISAGRGIVSQSGGMLAIEQTTPRLAINWQSFGIGAGESVVFRQPDASAIALNRVLGQDPSVILGSLSANGQVFVLNPNGVLFGAGAQVDVGGIVASTLGLSDADFLAGRYTFANGGGAGSVVNRGTIRAADGGYVALLAPQVVNEGLIAARLGMVALGAGNRVTLTLAGYALVGFSVDEAALDALVANKQLIQADGGTVLLSAQAKDALLATVVNNEGIVEARSVSVQNGVIRLDGGTSGVVSVGGRLDASGANVEETGGSVTITGEKIALANGAGVDASGHAGGGTVRVGGDYQGKNPDLHNASRTYVGPDATLRADAIRKGDGGKVIVWADDATQFYGTISARGGAARGDGGFVETSGKITLESTGAADAGAPNGRPGRWLLDPNNITIQTAGVNTNVTASPNFTTTNDNAIVTTGSIATALNAGTSVTVTTGSAGANTQAGNITVANAIAKTAGGNATLTLTATNNIVFNAGANVSSTSSQLNLTLNAGGAITNPATINTNGGVLTFNAVGASTQSGVIAGTGSVVKNGAGTLTLSGANTYTGATAINAGTLQIGAANRIADASAVTVAAGATFNLAGFAETVGSIAGAGDITLGAGTLTAGGNGASSTFSGGISGTTGGLTKTGAGTLTLAGSNAYGGTTRINAGTLRAEGGSAIPDASPVTLANAAGATLSLAASETVGSLSGGGTTGGNVVLGSDTLTVNQTGTTTYAGVVGGTGGLTKTGPGTLTLSRANTYTGATTVDAGTLALGASNVLADGSTLVVDGGTFAMTSRSDTVAGVQLVSGAITGTTGVLTSISAYDMQSGTVSARLAGAVGLDKTTAGTLLLTGTNTYTGTTTIRAGQLTLGSGNAIANTGVVDLQAGILQVNTGETIGRLIGASGTTLHLNGGLRFGDAVDTVIESTIQGGGGLAKQGTSVVTLTGDNTYTGATAVDAGRLRVESSTALGKGAGLGTTVAAGAALEIGGTGLAIDEPLTLNGTGVGGNGALRNLSGDNTWSGTITLAGTTELQSDAGTLTLGAANAVTGANRSLTFDGAGNGVIDGTVTTGSGTLTKNGAGTLTLSGANTYTGATTVNSGALIATSATALGGTGSGTTVNAGATLELDGTLTYAEPIALKSATLAWAAGDPTLTGAVALTGDNVVSGAAGTFTLAGIVSGTGGFDKTGDGTLVVKGSNTYGGLTRVSAGTLQVANAKALGATAGGTNVGSDAQLLVDGVAVGAEPVTLNGPGLSGAGAIASNGVASLAGPITLAADSMIAPKAGSTLTLAGPVDGAFGLTTGGAGTLILNGTVGGTTPLAFLTTGSTGATGIGAALVRTSGSQSYNNPTVIGGGVTLQSTGADLAATAPVTATAGALALRAAGTVDFANATNDFGTVGVTAGGDASLSDASGILLAASSVGGKLVLEANGAVGQTGAIGVAGASSVSAGPGPITLAGANDFGGDLALSTAGAAQVNDVNALALGASTVGSLTATAGGGVTLNGTVIATGAGSTIVLAGATFTNNAGAAALDPGAGRWLVYSADPATDRFGGLASGNQALWNRTYPHVVTEAGNRYVFAIQPTLAFTSTDVAKTYGQDATAAVAGAFAVTGFVDAAAYGGVFVQDTAANTYSGAPAVTSAGAPATAPVAGSPYPIAIDVTGVATATGYGKAGVSAGLLTIAPRPLTIVADPQTKVYGQPDPALTYAIGGAGLVSGDGLAGALTRVAGETVAGGPYAILQGTLTSAANPNYDITYSGSALAITPATLTYLAHPATVVQGARFPPFTGTVLGFVGTDTLANATTGTLAFGTTVARHTRPGVYPIEGSGLVANAGNYVFVQAPTNATALTIEPRGGPLPLPPGPLTDAYTGALASAAQSESTCAELQDTGQAETLCGAQQNFRPSEQVSLVPGWRRVIELGRTSLTVEGEGMRSP